MFQSRGAASRMSRIAARASNSDQYEMLRKKLHSVGKLEAVRKVAERLFQRAPVILEEMEEELRESGVASKHKQKLQMVELVLEKIQSLVEGHKDDTLAVNMPAKLCHYVSYIDLLVVSVKPEGRQWTVHLLRDYPEARSRADINTTEQGYELRSTMKTSLKELQLVPDVQAESQNDRIWLRVATVKLTKNRNKDKTKLEAARPGYLAYYPGEPYFYAASGLRESVGAALSASLGCGGWEQLKLQGRHVDSLRRMRLGRDRRDGPVRQLPGRQRFLLAGGEQGEAALGQPVIERGTWEMEGGFMGGEELRQEARLSSDLKVGQKLSLVGRDLVGGLLALAEAGVFTQPTPDWVTNFSTAGRNQVLGLTKWSIHIGCLKCFIRHLKSIQPCSSEVWI